jgi:lysophospholipase L1-like esterase
MHITNNSERGCFPRARWFRLAVLTLVLIVVVGAAPASGQDGGQQWVGTWSATPALPPPLNSGFAPPFATGFNNQTIRNIIHTSIGGSAVRVRLTNTFGTQPVTFNAVDVGIEQSGATVVSGSNHAVTFGGSTSIMIPAGAEALSDPVPLSVPSDKNVAVSLFTTSTTGTPTVHVFAAQTNYVASGNFAASDGGSAFTATATSWYFLDGVDVLVSPSIKGAVVALGDSITDGTASTLNANHRWPNDLARRFLAGPHGLVMSVLDEGFGGNRVLNDSACFGVNAVARLDRDVLAQTGVRDVILLEGINDIGFSAAPPSPFSVCFQPATDVSAVQIIAGYQQIITQVHAKGLKIFGGTLTPFKGAFYWSPAGEAKREAVNNWIKTSGEFDGVIDFAAATADPNDPLMFAPQFDSGDHLHPNDAGYQAMANAVDLALFLPTP